MKTPPCRHHPVSKARFVITTVQRTTNIPKFEHAPPPLCLVCIAYSMQTAVHENYERVAPQPRPAFPLPPMGDDIL